MIEGKLIYLHSNRFFFCLSLHLFLCFRRQSDQSVSTDVLVQYQVDSDPNPADLEDIHVSIQSSSNLALS